jgi:hypothetical protein
VTEHLLSKHKALNSNPSAAQKRKKYVDRPKEPSWVIAVDTKN